MKNKFETGLRLQYGAPLPAEFPTLQKAAENFDWVYLGAEFCENLLPGPDRFARDAALLLKLGAKVCLMTPPLGEKGLAAARVLFKKTAGLARKFPGRLEITFNDFGAAAEATALCPETALSAGRLLRDNFFFMNRRSLKLLNRATADFLTELRIKRLEIPFTGRLLSTDLSAASRGSELSLTLHYPYLDLTSSRACMTGLADIRPEDSVGKITCGKECLACYFNVRHPAAKDTICLAGNALFLKTSAKPGPTAKLLARNINRLVYSPRP